MSAIVLGATGLCGGFFLKFANQSTKLTKIYSLTRSKPKIQVDETKCQFILDKDSENWDQKIKELNDSNIEVLFTALATTRATAGGFDQQYKIDHDLNIKLAKAAKEKGCKTVVVVSSMGANEKSHFGYTRMKGEIERDLISLNFERTIILRPGIILGDRGEKVHNGAGNGLAVTLGNMFYRSRLQSFAGYPVEAEEISKVGVHLALDDSNEKVRIIESKDILDMAAKMKDQK